MLKVAVVNEAIGRVHRANAVQMVETSQSRSLPINQRRSRLEMAFSVGYSWLPPRAKRQNRQRLKSLRTRVRSPSTL
jgi:hypothetical protein